MSVFNKECPLCNASVAMSTESCDCGFTFNSTPLEQAAQDVLLATQEEELYETYLAARVSQLQEEVKIAQSRLDVIPEDSELGRLVTKTQQEATTASEEWAAQLKQLEKSRKAAEAAQKTLRKSNETRARALQAKEEAAKAKARAEQQAREQELAQAEAERRAEKEEQARLKEQARIKAEAKAEAELKAKAKAEEARIKAEMETELQKKAKKKPGTQAKPSQIEPAAKPKLVAKINKKGVSKKPGPAFQKAQAEKADAIMQLALKVLSVGNPAKKSGSPNGLVEPKNARPVPVAPAKPPKPTCPNCTADITEEMEKCNCGYQLKSANDADGIRLSDSDRQFMSQFGKDPEITKFG